MKKTLIAAGIAAVVAAPAFADVKISGVVEQHFGKQDVNARAASGTQAVVAAADEWVGTSDNSITFSASEDLGNGLSAFAKIVLDPDGGGAANKDQVVGIKGGFGTIVAGRMEDFTEGKLMSRMTLLGAGDASGDYVEDGAFAVVDPRYNAGRNDDGIAYVSPTMNGFHFGVAGFVLPGTASSSADAIDMALFYDNGPLSLAVSREVVKGTAGAPKQKNVVMTGSYTMGDLKVTLLREDVSDHANTAGADGDANKARVDYKMGNNTLTVAYSDEDFDAGTAATAAAGDGTVWSVELAHAFSKRTTIYANYTDSEADIDGSTALDLDQDVMSVGIIHKF